MELSHYLIYKFTTLLFTFPTLMILCSQKGAQDFRHHLLTKTIPSIVKASIAMSV